MKFTSKYVWMVLIALVAVSCKEAHHEHHEDVGGFRIIANGDVLAEQDGTTVTGSISLAVGETSPLMMIEFRDPEGHILNITDDDLSLQVDSGNEAVFTAQVSPGSAWSFTLTGVAAGSGQVTISLMHGNHADFESRPVPVTVD